MRRHGRSHDAKLFVHFLVEYRKRKPPNQTEEESKSFIQSLIKEMTDRFKLTPKEVDSFTESILIFKKTGKWFI